MDVIITGYIGIRGTAILARSRYEELLRRLPKWLVDEASCFDKDTEYRYNEDELKEVSISLSEGAVYAKEFTEFGVFEALFEMSKELKAGLEIITRDIPVKQETVEVCEALKANPYTLYSGVAAVIVAEDGKSLVSKLEEANVPAFIVGHTTRDNDKVLINEDERSFLPHVRKDELKNILGRKEYYERTNSVNC